MIKFILVLLIGSIVVAFFEEAMQIHIPFWKSVILNIVIMCYGVVLSKVVN